MSDIWVASPGGGPLALISSADELSARDRRSAVFLDRDGVINELVADPDTGNGESPLRVEDVRLLPGAASAIATLAESGCVLVCVTNQPAAAKATVSLVQLQAVHERAMELLAHEGVHLDGSYLCPHHPDGVVAGLAGVCSCRKPCPGMLETACDVFGLDCGSSWMVGDTDADIGAGRAIGCRTLLIRNSGSAHKRLQGFRADIVADSLTEGVEKLHLD